MKKVCTKLNVLEKVLNLTQDKLDSGKISIEDAQYINLIINKYLNILEK